MRRSFRHSIAAALMLGLASCGGQQGGSISDAERRMGAEQHPQLLAEFGGSYRGEESAYLAALGNTIAGAANLEGQCTFTLVNSDVVNAFAVPGCYIYVTRGLMAIVGSEAELASVLAHEVGHIAGDHSEQQEKRSIWRSLGVMAIGAITGSAELARLAGSAATYFTLRYSRKHEYEADDLGLEYLTRAGYDPYAAADMLGALARHQDYLEVTRGVDDASGIPEWALTHPHTENRIDRATGAARDRGLRPDELPEHEARYLARLDGLLYGDDPEQGFVLGRSFAHPVMRIAFEAPPGFSLTNSPQAIRIEGPEGLRGEFSGGPLPPGGLAAYAEAVLAATLGNAPVEVGPAEPARINGVPALVLQAAVQTREGAVPIALAAYAGNDRAAYHFLMVSQPQAGASAALAALFRSFRMLGPGDVAALRPRFLSVRRVMPGDDVRRLSASMAAEHPTDLFLTLNGLKPGEVLRPGQLVKLVTFAP